MQPSAAFVIIDVRLDIFPEVVGISQRPKLTKVPESAPYSVGVVMVVFGLSFFVERNLPDAAVEQAVLPIYVARNTPSQKCVIQSGLKFHLADAVLAFHLDTSEFLVPGLMSQRMYLVECFFACFCLQVQAGILNRGVTEPCFYFQ